MTTPIDRGMHDRYPRVYSALKRQGHDAAKAIEIILEARRGNRHALMWIRAIARLGRT